jgi:hypothetical protein
MATPSVVIVRRLHNFNHLEWVKKRPSAKDVATIVTAGDHGVLLKDEETGKTFLSFVPVDAPAVPLLNAVESIKYPRSYRTDGLQSVATTFGFQPRIPLRRDYCSTAALAYTYPDQHKVLIEYGRIAGELMRKLHPQEYDAQVKYLDREVHSDWRDPGTHFTSGIVNKKNSLVYHRDRGNVPGSWSTMLTLTRDLGPNGMLAIPEYDLALQFRGFEMTTFNGADIVHGVTPISVMSKTATRYSVVYYALKDMSKCLCREEEVKRIRTVKTQRSERRLSSNADQLLTELAAGQTLEEVKAASKRKEALFQRTKRKK